MKKKRHFLCYFIIFISASFHTQIAEKLTLGNSQPRSLFFCHILCSLYFLFSTISRIESETSQITFTVHNKSKRKMRIYLSLLVLVCISCGISLAIQFKDDDGAGAPSVSNLGQTK